MRRLPFLHPFTRLLKRGYDWMLGFADHRHAVLALGILSFAEASFFPLPPDPLLMAMGAGKPHRALRYALVTTLASVAGALLGYFIGAVLMDSLGRWLLDLYDPERAVWARIEIWYDENGVYALLLAALTPIPFKVFTIASGALALPFAPFVGAALLGRGARFFAEGLLLRHFGAPITAWMERWFDWVALGFTVVLVGGFVALRYL